MKIVKCPKCGNVWLYEGTGKRPNCTECHYTIYVDSARVQRIRFDLSATPVSVAALRPADRKDYAYAYVDVWNGHLTIGIAMYADDGRHPRVVLHDPVKFYLSTDDLKAAVEAAGGDIDTSGTYPIDDAIRERLRMVIANDESGSEAIPEAHDGGADVS